MRRFFIAIDERAFDRLQDVALQERRPVKEQAAVILEAVLGMRPLPVPEMALSLGDRDAVRHN